LIWEEVHPRFGDFAEAPLEFAVVRCMDWKSLFLSSALFFSASSHRNRGGPERLARKSTKSWLPRFGRALNPPWVGRGMTAQGVGFCGVISGETSRSKGRKEALVGSEVVLMELLIEPSAQSRSGL
jgi:hypothetical protein